MLSELRSMVRPGDLVGVFLPPGQRWLGILETSWQAGAAVFPVDHRLAPIEAANLLARARPTVFITGRDVIRRETGVPASAGSALIVATSGTSGQPRLVELSREAVDAAVRLSAAAIAAGPDDPWLCCIPVAHIGGLLVLCRHLLLGAPLTVHRAFSTATFRSHQRGGFTSLVPTQLGRLLDAGIDLSGFRAILVGGASLPGDMAARAERAGAPVVTTYGLTESCGGVVYDGRPLEDVEVRVDEAGELMLRGPTLMSGYRFDDTATRAAITDEGWLRTGDGGSIGEDGAVLVFGRIGDVINSGGEHVWPVEVEEALSGHPQVAAVAVAGQPDAEWGQRVVAYVVPRRRSSPPSLDSLRDFAATRIARFKAPRELVLVESLDTTALGKVKR